jgi:hypothetical protein
VEAKTYNSSIITKHTSSNIITLAINMKAFINKFNNHTT